MRGNIVFFTVKYHLAQESKTENVQPLGYKCNDMLNCVPS